MLRLNKKFSMIKKRTDFLKISKSDLKWVCPSFIIQIKKRDDDKNRVGFTVSKKVSKRAVDRNRVKRRMRAIAQEYLTEDLQDGLDMVFIGRKSTMNVTRDEMVNSIKHCIKRLELNKK